MEIFYFGMLEKNYKKNLKNFLIKKIYSRLIKLLRGLIVLFRFKISFYLYFMLYPYFQAKKSPISMTLI